MLTENVPIRLRVSFAGIRVDLRSGYVIDAEKWDNNNMVLRNVKAGRLHFTTSLESCLDNVDIVFSAVGTPPDEDGSADLRYVLEVAKTIGANMKKYTLVVINIGWIIKS